jgi:thioredoxin reductase (NADPH)
MDDAPPYDVIVVGAGAAGLSAATMLGRAKRRVLVVSKPGRRNTTATVVHNVPFADGASPRDVYAKLEADARRYGVELRWEEVVSAQSRDDRVVVEAATSGRLEGRRLLLATGRVDDLPSWLPEGAWGTSAFDCPYCHTYENDGGAYVCVGTGGEALQLAALARQYASGMTAVISDPGQTGSPLADLLRRDGVTVLLDTVMKAAATSTGGIDLVTATGHELFADTLLLADVVQPYRALADELGLDLTDEGYPDTTLFGMTSDPLVYSAGNVEGSPYFMWTGAASSGINAARLICEDLAFRGELIRNGAL